MVKKNAAARDVDLGISDLERWQQPPLPVAHAVAKTHMARSRRVPLPHPVDKRRLIQTSLASLALHLRSLAHPPTPQLA